MAKKGGKKGKKKGGKKKKEEVVKDELSEVDREIFQLQIADLTRKVERLKARVLELETTNDELQKNYETLDEDRADIISYLKREVQKKTDEISELQERIEGLQEAKNANTAMFTEKILQLEHEYKVMHEQLTSEIKLLSGKLNSLEEFRVQRDDLLKKFKDQELAMEDQELRHKEAMYEMERKFVVGKDTLKKEMESRLLQLSQDFQDTTNLRIAATTRRTIRENIALNTELNLMLETAKELRQENETMKGNDKKLRLGIELHKNEKKMAIAKNRIQNRIIENLTTEHENKHELIGELQHKVNRVQIIEHKLKTAQHELVNAQYQNQVLMQKLEASLVQQSALQMGTTEAETETKHLQNILRRTIKSVKDAIAIQIDPTTDEAFNLSRRESLLSNLLGLLNMAYLPHESETVINIPDIYETGDLGLISKISSTATAGSGRSRVSLQKSSSTLLKSASVTESAHSATSARSGGSAKSDGTSQSGSTVKSKGESLVGSDQQTVLSEKSKVASVGSDTEKDEKESIKDEGSGTDVEQHSTHEETTDEQPTQLEEEEQ